MYFIEDHQARAGQFGIVLQAPSEHTFGDHFDAGVAPDASFVAGLIANGVADVFAQQKGHSVACGASGQSARLEHHDLLSVQPRLVDQTQWYQCCFAGAGRSHKHGRAMGFERRCNIGDDLGDGKIIAWFRSATQQVALITPALACP